LRYISARTTLTNFHTQNNLPKAQKKVQQLFKENQIELDALAKAILAHA
jgi:hypothetical protein